MENPYVLGGYTKASRGEGGVKKVRERADIKIVGRCGTDQGNALAHVLVMWSVASFSAIYEKKGCFVYVKEIFYDI